MGSQQTKTSDGNNVNVNPVSVTVFDTQESALTAIFSVIQENQKTMQNMQSKMDAIERNENMSAAKMQM